MGLDDMVLVFLVLTYRWHVMRVFSRNTHNEKNRQTERETHTLRDILNTHINVIHMQGLSRDFTDQAWNKEKIAPWELNFRISLLYL